MGKPAMSGVKKNKKKGFKPSRGKTPGGRVYEVAQEILNAPEGGVAAVIAAALNDKEAPIRRDPRAFTMFSTRCRKKGDWSKCVEIFDAMRDQGVETNTIVSAGRIRCVSLVDRTSRSSRGVRFGVFDVVSPRRDTRRRERIARADGGKVHGRAEEDAAAQIGWIGSLTERRRCFGTSSWRGTSSWSLDSSGGT